MANKPISYKLFGLLLIILISCQKEKEIFPQIRVLSPPEQSRFDFRDTLWLEFEVTDLRGSLVVTLLDGDQVVNKGFKRISQTGSRYLYRTVFDNPSLPSKSYSIRIQAYNGENQAAEFLKINYRQLPLQREGLAILLSNAGQRELAYLPENGNAQFVGLNGDYPFLEVSPALGLIYVAPQITGQLTAYDKFLNQRYQVPNPALAGGLQYRYLIGDGVFVYALDNELFIKAYGTGSNPVRNYQLAQNRIPLTAGFNEYEEMLVGVAEAGFGQFMLLLLNPTNGAVLQSENLPHLPVSVASLNGTFFILCADGGSSVIYLYSPFNREFREWGRINNESPVDVVNTSNHLYVATNAGLYNLGYPPLAGVPFEPISDRLADLALVALCGDIHSDDVYLAAGSELWVYDGNNLNLVRSETPKSLINVEVLYNR